MFHRTKSFLSCVSLSSVLAIGACGGGGGSENGQSAQFSEASAEDIAAVVTVAGMAEFAVIAVPLFAYLDGPLSESDCPQVTATSIVGNGCTNPAGVRYDGSATIAADEASLFPSMTFQGFRRADGDGSAFYLDGTVEFTQESAEALRYDLALVLRFEDFGAAAGQAEAELSATCQIVSEAGANCTLEGGATANVEDLGEFTLEGTHTLGDGGGALGSGTELTARGEDSVQIDYDAATDCMLYTIEGGAEQEYCAGE